MPKPALLPAAGENNSCKAQSEEGKRRRLWHRVGVVGHGDVIDQGKEQCTVVGIVSS